MRRSVRCHFPGALLPVGAWCCWPAASSAQAPSVLAGRKPLSSIAFLHPCVGVPMDCSWHALHAVTKTKVGRKKHQGWLAKLKTQNAIRLHANGSQMRARTAGAIPGFLGVRFQPQHSSKASSRDISTSLEPQASKLEMIRIEVELEGKTNSWRFSETRKSCM